ncbi:hypothetical protein TNCV_2861471 [Trichonephila clavipes]|nr:hypothetical protein TNCV_2861471 [Trichonephila clavipes]
MENVLVLLRGHFDIGLRHCFLRRWNSLLLHSYSCGRIASQEVLSQATSVFSNAYLIVAIDFDGRLGDMDQS